MASIGALSARTTCDANSTIYEILDASFCITKRFVCSKRYVRRHSVEISMFGAGTFFSVFSLRLTEHAHKRHIVTPEHVSAKSCYDWFHEIHEIRDRFAEMERAREIQRYYTRDSSCQRKYTVPPYSWGGNVSIFDEYNLMKSALSYHLGHLSKLMYLFS